MGRKKIQEIAPTINAVSLAAMGWERLISIIPPGARLAPTSRVKPEGRGKVPGRLTQRGWMETQDWHTHFSAPEVIDQMGGNIGVATGPVVAVDIDVRDEAIANAIQVKTVELLGLVPVRVGAWPKRALLYRACGPAMYKQKLSFTTPAGDEYAVELLATGQQIVIWGQHPTAADGYRWEGGVPRPDSLPEISQEQIDGLFAAIRTMLEGMGMIVGAPTSARSAAGEPISQESLRGPIERVREALFKIPNTKPEFASRDAWVAMAHAIKGATSADPGAGLDMWIEWSAQWTGNTPEKSEHVWEGLKDVREGAEWIYARARPHGYVDAHLDFPAEAPAPEPEPDETCDAEYSDLWLAGKVVDQYGQGLRWAPESKTWFCYNEQAGLWDRSATAVRGPVIEVCRSLAQGLGKIAKSNAAASERKIAADRAVSLCSAGKIAAAAQLAQDAPALWIHPDDFDADPDLLGIPGGVIDLRTGGFLASHREQMISQRTLIAPAPTVLAPRWMQFLSECTGGDVNAADFIQRMIGYCLTGRTEEQVFFLLWGGGGNGKGVLLNTLEKIFGDYCRVAAVDTFTASAQLVHPVGIADLAGARMVQAHETKAGQRWNEPLIKQVTGGDAIKVRFMHSNPFRFVPRFKLLIPGNHQPALADVGHSMQRRMVVIPMPYKPAVVDTQLPEKLVEEYPGILRWAIEGARAWYLQGLDAPRSVRDASQSYIENEDEIGQWLGDKCDLKPELQTLAKPLYDSWCGWCGEQGMHPGSQMILSKRLRERGFVSKHSRDGSLWLGVEVR